MIRLDDMRMLRAAWLVLLFTTIGASASPWEYFPGWDLKPDILVNWLVFSDYVTISSAAGLCRRARQSYAAADIEGSSRLVRMALDCDPNHAPARALYTEIAFIQAQDRTSNILSER